MYVSFLCRPSVTEPATSGTFPASSWCHFALLFNVLGREILEACRCHVSINVRRPAISFLRFAVTMATRHSEKAKGGGGGDGGDIKRLPAALPEHRFCFVQLYRTRRSEPTVA
jgi:hypothetical protein